MRQVGLMKLFLMLFFAVSTCSYASYVTYTNTQTVESVPYVESGFHFSDGQGNSITYTKSRSVPVIVNQYPNARWIYVKGSKLPFNAIVYQYVNGRAVYYCRVEKGRSKLYGQLVPNQGCFVDGLSSQPHLSFQILIR